MAEDKITAAAGWCAPSSALYDALISEDEHGISFPKVSVNPGGLSYPRPAEPGTPEWEEQERVREAHEGLNALVRRLIGDLREAQDEAIDAALRDAIVTGMDVHVHPAPWRATVRPDPLGPTLRGPYRFIGIELRERTRRHTAVVWHPSTDHTYDDEDY